LNKEIKEVRRNTENQNDFLLELFDLNV